MTTGSGGLNVLACVQARRLRAVPHSGRQRDAHQHAELRHGAVHAAGAAQPGPHDEGGRRVLLRHAQCVAVPVRRAEESHGADLQILGGMCGFGVLNGQTSCSLCGLLRLASRVTPTRATMLSQRR